MGQQNEILAVLLDVFEKPATTSIYSSMLLSDLLCPIVARLKYDGSGIYIGAYFDSKNVTNEKSPSLVRH